MKRALVVCPGRGSYDRGSLGSLVGRTAPVIAACDAWRAAHDRPLVSWMDAAESYQSRLHVAGENASLLTFACTMADLHDLDRTRYDVVGVIGNSMGWYTALAAAGALPIDEGIRLVDTMGAYQTEHVIGGQVMYPLTDEDWRPDAAKATAVEHALADVWAKTAGRAWWSIRLGSWAVLGADEAGVQHLLHVLPPVTRGARTFPARLPLHSAFHTPLLADTRDRARGDLHDLALRAPAVPLVDGRGALFRPLSASSAAIWEYTLGAQVVEPYDFGASLITALRHLAPDVVVLLGPGNPLGGPVAATLVREGWGGMRTREAFDARQSADPFLLSFGIPAQRELLV